MAPPADVDRFTELLCSRLCHDLISPLGAINNGVEIVGEGDPSVLHDAIALIGSSARKATARLAYFRLAFGAWGSEPTSSFGSIRRAVELHFDEKKCPIIWSKSGSANDTAVGKDAAKLLLNLLLVAAECAQRDAKIDVSAKFDGGPRLRIAVQGERCKLRDDVRTGFVDSLPAGDLTVRNIIAQHCQRLCRSLGVTLAIAEPAPNSIEFKVG
jgi:histidine phosphotransferase ChpT